VISTFSTDIQTRLKQAVEAHAAPLLFATISGAHLYGFPSPDSDYDLRGCHLLPLDELLSLEPRRETLTLDSKTDGFELDLVTHDVRKFISLLLQRNGYVLEQLLSPWIVHTGAAHEELVSLAPGCITRHHVHHYKGFALNQLKLFLQETPRRVKPLLYVYRVLLTGIHLMRTGRIEANLVALNAERNLPGVADLIQRKTTTKEECTIDEAACPVHQSMIDKLAAELEEAGATSALPELPTVRRELDAFLIRLSKTLP
jgi:uncharacterized protein